MTPPIPPMPPRTSLVTKILPVTLSSRTKKYLHATLIAAASGGLSFLAFNLDSLIVLPKGVKGVAVGMLVAIIAKTAGYVLSEIKTDAP